MAVVSMAPKRVHGAYYGCFSGAMNTLPLHNLSGEFFVDEVFNMC